MSLLAPSLEAFFTERLITQRDSSPEHATTGWRRSTRSTSTQPSDTLNTSRRSDG